MTEKQKRLRWRRQPNETGLARVCQGWRGYILMYGDENIGAVAALGKTYGLPSTFYWYARVASALRNTASETPYDSVDAAKVAAMAWVRERLKESS